MVVDKRNFKSGKRSGFISKMLPAFLVIGFISTTSAQQDSPDLRGLAPLQAVANSNVQFTNSIYKVLSEKKGNIFFSPISIQVALAMTYMGAGGRTATQMSRGLHLPNDDELTKMGFNSLLTRLKSNENITLDIANKIYVENSISLKKEFKEIAQKSFLSDVESVNFKTNFEAVRVQINRWVEAQTNKKITELIAKEMLSEKTASVLVNAIYFKGDWLEKFNTSETKTEKFFVTPTQTKDVQMMHKTSKAFGFGFNRDLDCRVLELPYKGESLSMVVLVPNQLDGLSRLEARLPAVDFKKLIDEIFKVEVVVSLPKFKLEESIDLQEVLEKLGMVDMFQASANFSGMTDTPVSVSHVVHKAFIDVNEEGSEAAAATAVIPEARSAPLSVEANRPFVFAIVHKQIRTPLFVGRFAV